MKKTLLILLILSFTISCVTQRPLHSALEVAQNRVIEVPNKPKDDLYLTANDWMVDHFNSAESVIQYSDKESGTIIGKYLLSGTVTYLYGNMIDGRLYAKIKIEVKENKAKISITPTTDLRGTDQQIAFSKNQIRQLINSFETKIKITDNSDW